MRKITIVRNTPLPGHMNYEDIIFYLRMHITGHGSMMPTSSMQYLLDKLLREMMDRESPNRECKVSFSGRHIGKTSEPGICYHCGAEIGI